MIRRLSLVAGLLVCANSARAQGQREAEDAHLRERCRFAAQILTTGEPRAHYDWAVAKIRACDESAGPALAARWSRLDATTSRAALEELAFTSRSIRDQRLMDALVSVATSSSQPVSVRLEAISVLASYVNPRVYVSLKWLEEPPTNSSLPLVNDFEPSDGSVPLAAGTRETVLASLGQIASAEGDSVVGRASAALRAGLGG